MADGITVKVNYPTPDIDATEEEIHKTMTEFTLDTLKTWVLESVAPVPVWSGAARATFLFHAATANTSIQINPVVESRILLGVGETQAEVFAEKANKYGWSYHTDVPHMPIVEERVGFVAAGLKAIKDKQPKLPQPKYKNHKA